MSNYKIKSAFPPEDWATTQPSKRVARLKNRLLQADRQIDVERARYTTQSYQSTEGQPMPLRRAKMLLHLARQMSLAIHPDEVIVGNRSLLPRMGVIAPEGAVDWIEQELENLPTRPQDKFQITGAQIKELREQIFPYWRGKTLEDAVAARIPENIGRAVRGKAFSLNQTDHAQGHILPDVESWLRLGIRGLRRQVLAVRQRAAVQTGEQQNFYEAGLIVLQAAGEFMLRHMPAWPGKWPQSAAMRPAGRNSTG